MRTFTDENLFHMAAQRCVTGFGLIVQRRKVTGSVNQDAFLRAIELVAALMKK